MSTTVAVTTNTTTVDTTTSPVAVTVAPTTTSVVLSVGPVTLSSGANALAGSGSPVGVVTATAAGQLYQDTDTGIVYVNFETDNSSWVELLRNY